MHLFIALSVLALTASAVAQDVDANDIPSQCSDVCDPVVSLTASCDRNSSDDAAEMKCVCNGPRASTSVPNCAACLDKYSRDGKDNDANDLVRKCSFASTTYGGGGASSSATSSSSASMNAPGMASGSATMSVAGNSASPESTSTPNAADKSTEAMTGVWGTSLLGFMAFIGL